MSDKSPLFVSSLELIAHSTELFAQKNPKKYKFIILHLANAVELILKDCVIDQGISIYEQKRTNRTIGLWECIDILKGQGINITELPVIELLIDDRNTIQHRFGYPSAESIYYYIEQVISFFQRILNEHYNIQLIEALKTHLPEEHMKLLGLVKDEYDYLDKLASISLELAVLESYKIVEQEIEPFLAPFAYGTVRQTRVWGNRYLPILLGDLKQQEYLTTDINKKLQELQSAYNFAAHRPDTTSPEINWHEAYKTARELVFGLQKARNAKYAFVPKVKVDMGG